MTLGGNPLSDAWLDAAQDRLPHGDLVGSVDGDIAGDDNIRDSGTRDDSINRNHRATRDDSINRNHSATRDHSAIQDHSGLEHVATPADFGRELGALWARGGLSMRRAARLAELPHSTLHDWSNGRVPEDAD